MDQSEVLRFEQQTRITKLSQAIREGAKLRPQCRGWLFSKGGSCAIGAAYEALFGYPTNADGRCDAEGCDWLLKVDAAVNHQGLSLAWDIGMKMNDVGMTREAIADKLEAMGY